VEALIVLGGRFARIFAQGATDRELKPRIDGGRRKDSEDAYFPDHYTIASNDVFLTETWHGMPPPKRFPIRSPIVELSVNKSQFQNGDLHSVAPFAFKLVLA